MSKIVNKIVAVLLLPLTLVACNKSTVESEKAAANLDIKDKVAVMVSFNPLREFAEAVGGDKVSVKVMVPAGSEPHDFEPKPRDLQDLASSDIFIYNGLGMEAWVDKTLSSVNNSKLLVVNSSTGAEFIKHEEEKEEDPADEHGEFDPHIWLSLREAKVQSKNILEALVKADSDNKEYYEKNYEAFADKLDGLYNEYKVKFDGVSNKNFVTGHAAFAYLCRDFGLKQMSVEDVFAEGEPTPKKIKDLVDFSKVNNIRVVFMEEMASPKVSETLAMEVGAKVEKIYTIESREDNKDYLQSMRDNLEKVYNSVK